MFVPLLGGREEAALKMKFESDVIPGRKYLCFQIALLTAAVPSPSAYLDTESSASLSQTIGVFKCLCYSVMNFGGKSSPAL